MSAYVYDNIASEYDNACELSLFIDVSAMNRDIVALYYNIYNLHEFLQLVYNSCKVYIITYFQLLQRLQPFFFV